MKIVNLTPHALNVRDQNGNTIEIAPSGIVARVGEIRHDVIPWFSEPIGVTCVLYGDVTNLPVPEKDTALIVSAMVLSAIPDAYCRWDVFAPGPAIRDDAGRIIGCDGLTGRRWPG
jgi:hypothetical protein